MINRIRDNLSEALTIAGLFLAFLIVFLGALQLRPEPGLFPRIIGASGLLVMMVVAWRFLRGHSDLDADDQLLANPMGARIAALVSPLIYGVLFYIFGFYISAGVAIAIIPWMLGYRRPWFLLWLCVGTIAAMTVMFTVILDVPIPLGVAGEWFMRSFIYKD